MFWKKKIKEEENLQFFGNIPDTEETMLLYQIDKVKDLFEEEKDVKCINIAGHIEYNYDGTAHMNQIDVYCEYKDVEFKIREYVWGECINNIKNALKRKKLEIDCLLDSKIFIEKYKSGPLRIKFDEPYSKEEIEGQICYKKGTTLKEIIDFIGDKFPDMTDLEFDNEEKYPSEVKGIIMRNFRLEKVSFIL